MYQHHGYKPADSTMLDWVRRYSKLAEEFKRGHIRKSKVKGRIYLDEVVLKVGKRVLQPERHRQLDQVQPSIQVRGEQNSGDHFFINFFIVFMGLSNKSKFSFIS